MAEAIVYGMAGNILSDLSSGAVQGIGSTIGVKKELKKLEQTLSTVNAVLKDADEQQLINNHQLKDWVKRIKDACYEAEDILDDFATEALRRQLRIRDNTFRKVWNFAYSIQSVSFHFQMSRRIEKIRQKFDEIADDKNNFHLTARDVEMGVVNRGREQTHSFIDESDVFGRDGEKNEIISLLSDGDMESVVAIIGMGGLGKTTLAQLVYNDNALGSIFQMKMWVGVYQDFDVKKISEKIIKSATNKECPNLEMDQLRSRIQEKVKGKKFLMVLDDVWNEDNEKWDKLKFVMSSGAPGSKVLMTTRSIKAASVMKAKPYVLEKLTSDDCWNLFEQRAFAREDKHPNMVVIGKELVKKCHGVPLAAKTLGSLMRLKTKEREWETVRDSDVWKLPQRENDILPALRLSYNHLPAYLKQCFAYFASFHETDGDYDKNVLINSWIAHGFVRSLEDVSGSLEDVGNEYVKELLWRSLIQEPKEDICGNMISFKVHDLVHNLARDVAGTEYLFFEEGLHVYYPEEVRYANLVPCPDSELKMVLSSMPNLREVCLKLSLPVPDMISRFKRLRSLSIKVTIKPFPNFFGKLKHLRELSLASDDIQTLPKSVTKLSNLQTFDLSSCPKLRELPEDMGKMINVRHIHLAEDSPMSHMPSGFKFLTSLRTLTVFFVGKDVGCKLNELQGLKHIQGQLIIKNLQNVRDAGDCAKANLKEKKRLEILKLLWNNQEGVSRKETNMDVLENLQPHPYLKILKIKGYGGSSFASWMMEPLFPKLVEVSLMKCRSCESIPPFGNLPLLRVLLLKDMDALKSIEGRGEHGAREWFPSLKKLTIGKCPRLESFGELSLPSLEMMPLLPSLERLEVNFCGEKLVQALLMLPQEKTTSSSLGCLKYLNIEECGDLVLLPENWLLGLVSIEELVIKKCRSLVSLEDEGFTDGITSLTSLEISELPKLVSLPQWIPNLTKLQSLYIQDCGSLIHVPDRLWELTSLRTVGILGCEKLKSLPDGMQHLTALETLGIARCDSLMSRPNGLGSLASLKTLGIGCSPNLPSLPEQLQQLTGLHDLAIFNCQTLLTFPEWLVNFTCLRSIYICDLRNLQSLPEWISKLTALEKLIIVDCKQLIIRCQKGTGADWPKIAHIPNIKLNEEWIQQA